MEKIPGIAWEEMHRELEALRAKHGVFEAMPANSIEQINEIIGTLRERVLTLLQKVASLRESSDSFKSLADHDMLSALNRYGIAVEALLSEKKRVKPLLYLCTEFLGEAETFYDADFRATLFTEAKTFCNGTGKEEDISATLRGCMVKTGKDYEDMQFLHGWVNEDGGERQPREIIEEYFDLTPVGEYLDQAWYDRFYELAIAYVLDESDSPAVSDELQACLTAMERDEQILGILRDTWREVLQIVHKTRILLHDSLWLSHHALESTGFHAEGKILEVSTHDVSRLIFKGENVLHTAFGRNSVVQFDIQGGLEACIHPGTVVTLLYNIVRNAGKHGHANLVKITLREDAGTETLILEVADNGTGVTVSPVERVFEEGFSGGQSTGLGLGLAIERLSRMGATIACEPHSGIGNGAKFIMHLKRR